jgi:hypothetical protein
MMAFDMTAQLAPIIWAVEGLMLFAVAWLLGTYLWQEMHGGHAGNRHRMVKSTDPGDHNGWFTSDRLAA